MHQEIEDFVSDVKKAYPDYFTNADVVEFGSYNVNGSVRQFFTDCNYVGLDIHEGKDVDLVCRAKDWIGIELDVAISCEMLEHDCEWKESLKAMYGNLRSGGLMIVTCASTNRPEHGTNEFTPEDSPATKDWYRNLSIEDFESVLPKELFSEYFITVIREDMDLLFYGIKK